MDVESESKVQVKLVTKQLKYSIPDVPMNIPSTVSINDLNNIVNQLLFPDQPDKIFVNFDFLVNGELLRLTLIEHLNEKEISTEDVIEIEYLDKLPAPSLGECLMHDDWISSVKGQDNLILSGCFDGSVRIWKTEGDILMMMMMMKGHQAPVKSVAWLQSNDSIEEKLFVTGSDDGTCIIWSFVMDEKKSKDIKNSDKHQKYGKPKKLHICKVPSLDKESSSYSKAKNVQCVAVNKEKSLFASGSWDSMINIWSTIPNSNDCNTRDLGDEDMSNETRKKRKLDNDHSQNNLIRLPVRTLEGAEGHTDKISSVDWLDDSKICSASWDHTIKLWDVHTAQMTANIMGSKVFLDLSCLPINGLIVASSADRHIRLYDPRITIGALVKNTFTSHTGWVSSVCWSPNKDHLFMSGSYDCNTKLWDVRSPKAPLYDMRGHEDKVLCCDWSIPSTLISGGADKQLKIFINNEI